jgi:hypothetical protein
MAELAHIQIVIHAALAEQFLVLAPLDHLAVLDDDNLIGVANRAETMRDDETRSTPEQFSQRLLDQSFGARVHAGEQPARR